MNHQSEAEIQKAGCCVEGECCPSSSCDAPQEPPGRRPRWKTPVFVVVMVLAVAMAAYSVLTPDTGAAVPTIENVPGGALTALVDRELTSLYNLDGIFPEHDFAFVILPGKDEASTTQVARLIANATSLIEAEDVHVGVFTLSPDSPDFANVVDRLGILGLPAVLAWNYDGTIYPVAGEITETGLLQAYLGCCGSSSSCCPVSPNSSSSCCP